jgi:hypothetical protein
MKKFYFVFKNLQKQKVLENTNFKVVTIDSPKNHCNVRVSQCSWFKMTPKRMCQTLV